MAEDYDEVIIVPYAGNCILRTRLIGDTYNKLAGFPGFHKWKDGTRDFIFRPSANNIAYANQHWPNAKWQDGAELHIEEFIKLQKAAQETCLDKERFLEDDGSYQYKTKPFKHQQQAFLLSRDKKNFALFMEQGTGKTKVIIDNAAYLYAQGRIDSLIIIAPNGAHLNWIDIEIPIHLPDWLKWGSWVYSSNMTKYRQDALDELNGKEGILKIYSFNVEGFSSEKSQKVIEHLLRSQRCLVVVDESQYIKNPSAGRTKYLTKVCRGADYKRIMTGTSITKGLEDIYAQLTWLDTNILGYDSFYTFKGQFCIAGGFEHRAIVGYKNIDQLQQLIDGYSYRVLKKDCLDLPEKLYKRWRVELNKKERAIYDSLLNNYYADLQEQRMTAQLAIVRLLRLQQISCGWFPVDDGELQRIPGDNAKLEAVRQHCQEVNGKVVIWARFKDDIRLIEKELINDHGKNAVASYFGDTDVDDRMGIVKNFQNKEHDLRYIVAHPKAAGRSITLTACENPIYHSNDFDLELRLQSEDRTHRIGTTGNVTYTDIEAKGTVDRKIISSLRKKKKIADMVNKDPVNFFMEEREIADDA